MSPSPHRLSRHMRPPLHRNRLEVLRLHLDTAVLQARGPSRRCPATEAGDPINP
jgi:hypothetical protein